MKQGGLIVFDTKTIDAAQLRRGMAGSRRPGQLIGKLDTRAWNLCPTRCADEASLYAGFPAAGKAARSGGGE